MKVNMGKTDRTFRMLLSIVIAFVGYYYKSWWGLVALAPLVTAFTGYCPLYTLLGFNTCKFDKEVKH
jgi:Protein of unknown function (DUF2892)